MYFNKWVNIYNKNKKLYDLCLDIQESFIKDYLEEEDTSVGLYGCWAMNKHVVKDINDSVYGCRVLEGWTEKKFDLLIDEEYVLTIEMVKRGFEDGGWEITNAFTEKEYDFFINEEKYIKEHYEMMDKAEKEMENWRK